ncbi:MAG: hypothetical protein KKH28_14700 [Elusimicrobia bacterium]|nr:hypothetical protein [Elusimicrobiota bacterium]
MKKIIFAVCLLACQSAVYAAQGGGRFGAGIILGAPTGLSAKYWLDKTRAVDGALGFGDLSLHADYLRHGTGLLGQPKSGRLSTYWGVGAKIKDHKDGTVFGLRAVGGAAYEFPKNPAEVFFELAPVLRLSPDSGWDLDAGIGVRYYFK